MPLLLGVIEVVGCLVVFFVLGARGWPGDNDDCLDSTPDTCYCERPRTDRMVLQPVNTWSNVGFILVGLVILAWLTFGSGSGPMQEQSLFSVGLGLVIVFLGPGSMFFHASLKDWGGWIDNVSMNLFISWVALYDLARMVHAGEVIFLALWIAVNAGLGVFLWVNVRRGWGKWVFAGLIAVLVLTSVLVALSVGGVHRNFTGLIVGLVIFGVALAIQQLSQTGRPLCDPDSLLQGHAAWHVLAALAAGSIYLYLRTEM